MKDDGRGVQMNLPIAEEQVVRGCLIFVVVIRFLVVVLFWCTLCPNTSTATTTTTTSTRTTMTPSTTTTSRSTKSTMTTTCSTKSTTTSTTGTILGSPHVGFF